MGYKALVNQMKCVIASLDPDTEFFLQDIMVNPPAILGRTLYEGVDKGTIPNVECIGIVDGVEKYRKLEEKK